MDRRDVQVRGHREGRRGRGARHRSSGARDHSRSVRRREVRRALARAPHARPRRRRGRARGVSSLLAHHEARAQDPLPSLPWRPCSLVEEAGSAVRATVRARSRASDERLQAPEYRVLDVGVTDDGAPYLVSDLLQGPTLGQVLRAARYAGQTDPSARPPLCQPACVWRIGRDISPALDAVHPRGVVHRAVKPANLMLSSPTGDWVAVLTDFGIAVRAGVCDPSDWGIGTPRYMAPELVSSGIPAAASRLVTTASDVYSFAIVLYELLTLAHPYAARVKELLNGRDRSVVDTAERRRVVMEVYRLAQRSSNATPARAYAPWLPQSVEQALLRALSRDPAARPPSILEFFADLAELRDLGGGYDTMPLDWSSSLEEVEDDISTDASGAIQLVNWIDGERAASRAASLANANVAAVQMVDRDRTPPPKVSKVPREVTGAPTIDEKLERAAWSRRAASLAAAFVVVMAVGVVAVRSYLPAP